jgi:DNA mismatch endonuclease (patch repair protein)
MDTFTPEQRSRVMAAIKGQDTTPEMRVRRLAHALGYRFRLHDRRLPGSPDLTFPKRRKAIFVHGCFWHSHSCRDGKTPKSNQAYWRTKLEANVARDHRKSTELEKAGWTVMTIWECETRDRGELQHLITRFLD